MDTRTVTGIFRSHSKDLVKSERFITRGSLIKHVIKKGQEFLCPAKAPLRPCERNKQLDEIICITIHPKHGRFWQSKAQNVSYLKK